MNIEESIKILDKFITEHKLFNIKHSDGLEEAIETLLTAYEKEKEEHKKECHNCDEYTARLGELETENRMLKSELEKEDKTYKKKSLEKCERRSNMKYLISGFIGKVKDLKIDNFVVKGKIISKGGNEK